MLDLGKRQLAEVEEERIEGRKVKQQVNIEFCTKPVKFVKDKRLVEAHENSKFNST